MAERIYETDKNLTAAEALIMRCVWSVDGDISVQELMHKLRTQYQKDYVRTTMSTFLSKLAEKGFIQTYREGRTSYVHPLRTEEEYKSKRIREEADFWFAGNVFQVVAALYKEKNFSAEDMEELRRVLDGLED